MSYPYEIVRYPAKKFASGWSPVVMGAPRTVVFSGALAVANEAGLRIVNNHLAMSADRRAYPIDGDWALCVEWKRSPRGPKCNLFRVLRRFMVR